MEIYQDLSNPASKEFEKLLNSQLSKVQIEEGKIINGKIKMKDGEIVGDPDGTPLQFN